MKMLRFLLLAILVSGLLGIASELLLIEHIEDFWQIAPLFLIFAALLALSVQLIARRSGIVIRIIQAVMFLIIASGAIGTYLHYIARAEFQLEVQPELQGWALFWTTMKASTPPALAPAAMVHLGLIGLAYTYRHPALRRAESPQHQSAANLAEPSTTGSPQ